VCIDPAAHPGTPNGPYSMQRRTNGNDTDRSADDFVVAVRTPGGPAPCLLDPKCIRDLTYSPCVPLANQAVTVSLHVSGGSYSSIRTFYKLGAAALFASVGMVPGPDTTFVATLPGQANLSRVQYWCRVTDSAGDTTVLPPGAPGVTLDYRVGIVPISTIQGTFVADSCASSTYA